MKAGPYCGYGLREIVDIKQKEQHACGKFFWGYGGVFCRPHSVQAFASYARKNKNKVKVFFTETESSYKTSRSGRFTQFSQNDIDWQNLPRTVLLVGNKQKPHFAIVARNMREVNFEINLTEYILFSRASIFPSLERRLDTYFKYRVDKVCGIYQPQNKKVGRIVKIAYTAELVEPYCVFIR